MKKSNLFVATVLFLTFINLLTYNSANSQTTNLVWAKTTGAAGTDNNGASIALDASGNVYTTGTFQGTVDFDPGAGTSNLTSAGGNDVFISKLDASGNLVWAKSLGGTTAEYASSIAVDVNGNVYTIGYFYGTTDFDPGAGTYNLTQVGGAGSCDIFISKLDASGSFVWAKAFNGVNIDTGFSIALDANGNVYTTGYFFGTVDFDPSATTINLSSAGGTDIFISKLDALGNFVWATRMGGTGGDAGTSIAVDNGSGSIYATGNFTGTVDFDPGPTLNNLISAGAGDIFAIKLDQSGSFVWARAMGGTSGDAASSIAINTSGDVYITGNFSGTADFDPSATTYNLTSAGNSDIFISKLWASGNFAWAGIMGGTSADNGNSIALDASGNVYTTGYFVGTVDFDPSAGGVFNLTSSGGQNIFISKLSTTGSFIWAKSLSGGSGANNGNDITVNSAGDVYTTGSFQGTVDFNQEAGILNISAAGNTDIFVHKMVQCNVSLATTQTNVTCFGGNNGSATASIAGGVAPFNYLWQHSTDGGTTWVIMSGQTSSTANGLSAGNFNVYSITITDQNGCMATTTVDINQPPNALAIATSQSPVTCSGGNNGQASVTVTGITNPPYIATWGTTPSQSGFTANNLYAGTYNVVVSDANGCTATENAVVTEPTAISVSTIGSTTICSGQSTTINCSANGGSSPYLYSWVDGANTYSGSSVNVSPTTTTNYSLTVTDGNNCSATGNVTVNVNQAPIITNSPLSQTICSGASTSLVNINSNVTGSSFVWTATSTAGVSGYAPSGTNTLPVQTISTSAGTSGTVAYTITPTGPAPTSCPGTPVNYIVTVNPLPSITTLPSNIVICSNGTIAATNFSSTITGTSYTWTNNNTTIGLAASGSGNISSFTATNATATPITALITVTPTSAAPDLCPGPPSTYTITVNPTPTVTVPSNFTLCANGTVPANTFSSNIAGVTFSWTNSNTAIGLAASGSGNILSFTATNSTTSPLTATITVTPTTGAPSLCSGTPASYTITVNPRPTVTVPSNITVCANGTVSTTAFSSTIPGVTYTWTNSNTNIGLAAGGSGNILSFTATNSTTAPITATITVTPTTATPALCAGNPSSYTLTVNPIPNVTVPSNIVLCAGGTIAPSNFTSTIPGTTYTWTNNNASIGLAANGVGSIASFTALNPTTSTKIALISVIPTSPASCPGSTATYSITVNPHAAISLSSAVGTNAQTVCINNVITSITYMVNGGGTGATVTGLPAGVTGSFSGGIFTISGTPGSTGTFNYTVTTTGTCNQTSANGSITVNPNAAITLTSAAGTNSQSVCINTAISPITYLVTGGGTGAGVTGLPAGVTGSFSGSVFTISGSPSASGTFNYTITTTGLCAQTTSNGTMTINPNAAITLTSAAGSTIQSLCINTAITSITYSITGGGTGATATGLPAGVTGSFTGGVFTLSGIATVAGTFNYVVTTTGTCSQATANGSITINAIPSAPTLSSNSPVNIGNTLSLSASSISGATYNWTGPNGFSSSSQNPSIPNITSAASGTYSVTVSVNGCTSTVATTLVTIITISITTSIQTVSCAGGTDGAAAVMTVSGGTAPYSYSWNTIPTQTSQAIFGVSAGTYTVTVTDSIGSSTSTNVTISQPSAISIVTGGQVNVSCFGGNNGTVNAIAGGGTPPYTYSWNTFPTQTSMTASGLSSGNYIVTVTDDNGCLGTNTVIITQPNALAVTMTTANTDCGTNNGSATANVTGGTSTYTYLWSNSASASQILNLFPQTYTLTVTDAKGCIVNSSATIGVIPANFNLAFTGSPQNAAAPLPATFSNTTPNLSNYNFSWYWGDGNSVNNNNATVFYTYNFAGTYDVALIATNIANGCQDTLAKHPYINVTGTGCGHTATVAPAGIVNKCAGDTLILTASTDASTPYSYQWNIGSVTISGANSNTIAVTQGGYYSVTVIKNNCPVTSSAVQVNFTTIPTQPTITSTGAIVPCVGGSVTLTASTISGVTYSWNTTPVETSQSISISTSGNYAVTATNATGCSSVSEPYTVNASFGQVPLCMATVDSLSTHNIIFWDKTGYASVDSFKIYREVTTNTYAYLASVSNDSLSEYHDYDANPNVTSYKYKLAAKDTCGNESLLSDYHTTIHLQNLGGGNLQWTLYDIENAGNPVTYYRIYRDDTGTGTFSPISSTIPGGNTTYTDVNFNLYPNANYRVDVAWSITCTPTRATINTTRSNIKGANISIGIQTNGAAFPMVHIYPNPANENITIELDQQPGTTSIKINNIMGQLMEDEIILPGSGSKTLKQINVSSYSKGLYTISIECNGKRIFRKMVVN